MDSYTFTVSVPTPARVLAALSAAESGRQAVAVAAGVVALTHLASNWRVGWPRRAREADRWQAAPAAPAVDASTAPVVRPPAAKPTQR